MVGNHAMSASA
uniref:Uncharacterized protein n=1 Tax=Lepeophtheirus salmonis TaxID=72036 RepID=A0A0K2VLK7_LEPSM